MTTANPVFCAIDTKDPARAAELVGKLQGHVGGIKLGLEFIMANGPQGCAPFIGKGMPVFIDVKLHDIPNTVAGGIGSLLTLGADFITIHTAGGAAMMQAAAKTAATAQGKRPKILGITVLTSLDANDLSQVGQEADPARQAERLALLAKESGLDGVVCSPAEVARLRPLVGKDFILMVPGIRPAWAATGDQKRVMTPREAMQAGASYLVIGRPITGADDPAAAADRVMAEIRG